MSDTTGVVMQPGLFMDNGAFARLLELLEAIDFARRRRLHLVSTESSARPFVTMRFILTACLTMLGILVPLLLGPGQLNAARAAEADLRPVTATVDTGLQAQARLDTNFVPLRIRTDEDALSATYTLLPADVAIGVQYRAVRPAELRTRVPSLTAARWIAAGAATVGTPIDRPGTLNSSDAEYAARQAAIWILTAGYQASSIETPQIRARAIELVAASRSAVAPDTNYPTAYGLTLNRVKDNIATVDLQIRLSTDRPRDAQGAGIQGELVTVKSLDQDPLVQITGGDGSTGFRVNRPAVDQDYTAEWSTNIQAGLVLEASSVGVSPVVTAAPIFFKSTSNKELIVSGKVETIPLIGVQNVVQDLSLGSKWGFLLVVLTCVGILGSGVLKFLSGHLSAAAKRLIVFVAFVVAAGIFINANWPTRPTAAPVLEVSNYPRPPEYLPTPVLAATSSVFPKQGQCFSGWRAVDGQPGTAWLSAPGGGSGQLLALDLGAPYWITDISIVNGLASNYNGNGRVRGLQLIGDGGYVQSVSVDDSSTERRIRLEAPYLLTRRLVLRVTEQTSGFNSAALAEVRLIGFPATSSDGIVLEGAARRTTAPGFAILTADAGPDQQCGRP